MAIPMRVKRLIRRALPAVAALGVLGVALPASASVTGPFVWPSGNSGAVYTWCPNLHAYDGCNTTDGQPQNFQNTFSPAQVNIVNTSVTMTMNSNETVSGAINESTYPLSIPFTVSETLNIPCNSSSQVYNWPAFWVDGSGNQNGKWPAGGEFDIAEAGGTGAGAGVMTYAYHYADPVTGAQEKISGTPSGNWCGSHQYKLHVTSTAAYFVWAGSVVKQITWSSSVPAPTDTMEAITDYAYSPTYAGPAGPGQHLAISGFAYVAS